mgnify:CR=1 FL=1
MALTTPILYSMSAFDASQAATFTFNVLGGNQVVANTLTIKNNATLEVVYEQTQTTFQFYHTVPANTLSNGTYYQATLTTKDASGNVSSASNVIQFHCYTTPTFLINNMPTGNVVSNSSYSFQVEYNQIQGEILNAYVFNLYSISGILISTSGQIYNTSLELPFIGSYLFSGFEDKTSYIIEVNGVTAEGTKITTGKIGFTTSYTKPDTYSILNLANNCGGGYISIESNIYGIDGETNPENPIYIDNKELDVRENGSYVQWEQGYKINDNFTMRLWGRNFNPDTEIIKFSNTSGDTITIIYYADDNSCCCSLRALNSGDFFAYVINSNKISLPKEEEQLFIWMRKVDNLYDLKIENRGVVS